MLSCQLDYTSNIIDNCLFVGMTTKMCLRQLFNDGNVSEAQQNTFFKSVCLKNLKQCQQAFIIKL